MRQFSYQSGTNLFARQSNDGDSISTVGYELRNVSCTPIMDVDYGADVTLFKIVLGKVDRDDYRIQLVHFITLFLKDKR